MLLISEESRARFGIEAAFKHVPKYNCFRYQQGIPGDTVPPIEKWPQRDLFAA